MQDTVFERFEIELRDFENGITNIQRFSSKSEAIRIYKKYKELYKDKLTVSLVYTKIYISS